MTLFHRLKLGSPQRELERFQDPVPERNPLVLINSGNALEDAGQYREALALYDAAIALAPGVARAHLNRGNALLALKELEAATAAYSAAIDRDPNYAAAHFNLGNAYVAAGRRDEAFGAYRRALVLKPDFADAEMSLGALYDDLGRRDAAAASYQRAIQINPNYAEAHGNLGNVLIRLGRPEHAILSYRRAVELNPQLDTVHYELGNALQQIGNCADAATSYRRALDCRPGFVPAQSNLAQVLEKLGRNVEAAASHGHARKIAPDPAVPFLSMFEDGRRLHIGGKANVPGWEILDAIPAPYVEHVCNANDLSQFADGTFTEIYASHVVEHLDYNGELQRTLKEWNRTLIPGGRLLVSVPDLDVLAKMILDKEKLDEGEPFLVMRMVFGGHVDKHDYHVVGLNAEFLIKFLQDAGYVNIRKVTAFGLFNDTSSMIFKGVPISLNAVAEKHV